MAISERCAKHFLSVIKDRNQYFNDFLDTLKSFEKDCDAMLGEGIANFKFDCTYYL